MASSRKHSSRAKAAANRIGTTFLIAQSLPPRISPRQNRSPKYSRSLQPRSAGDAARTRHRRGVVATRSSEGATNFHSVVPAKAGTHTLRRSWKHLQAATHRVITKVGGYGFPPSRGRHAERFYQTKSDCLPAFSLRAQSQQLPSPQRSIFSRTCSCVHRTTYVT
jgi:hypothetical protein